MHRQTVRVYATTLLETSLRSGACRYGRSPQILSQEYQRRRADVIMRNELVKMNMSTSSGITSWPLSSPIINTKSGMSSKPSVLSKLNDEIPNQVSTSSDHNLINDSEKSDSLGESAPFPALLETSIIKAKTVKELIELSTNSTLILKHACLIISRLGDLSYHNKDISYETLKKDESFRRICNLIQRGNYSQTPQSLFMAINGFQRLGISCTSDMYKSLDVELKWALRRCPVRFLARAIEIFSGMEKAKRKANEVSSEESKEMIISAVETLQRRWVEVNCGSDFICVFKIISFLSDETRSKLEDRAVEIVQGFSPPEMRKMFVILGSQKRRPTPLLRALAFHLSKSEERPCGKDLIELIYALNELTFADPVLMEKICSDLCPEVPGIENPALISSLVTSLGQMRFKHKGLIQIIDEWIMSHLTALRPFDCAAWLLTCAVLNFHSISKEVFCSKAASLLANKASSNEVEWINIVHALVILNEDTKDLIASVLSPEISAKIDAFEVKGSRTKIKLLNINAIAKLKSSEYKGPLLDPQIVTKWTEAHVAASDHKLSSVILESLGNFLPAEKYLLQNLKQNSGVFIDAVTFVNDKLEPLPAISDKTDNKRSAIAIVVEGYPALCLGVKDPTGSSILNRFLLQSDGYRVISIPYTEFNARDKLVRRVKYLEQKLKSLDQLETMRKTNR